MQGTIDNKSSKLSSKDRKPFKSIEVDSVTFNKCVI